MGKHWSWSGDRKDRIGHNIYWSFGGKGKVGLGSTVEGCLAYIIPAVFGAQGPTAVLLVAAPCRSLVLEKP